MSADKNDHSPESHETDHLGHEGHNHGSFKSYMIGFVLSVILTAIPFALVMTGVLPTQATALIVMGFAVVQINQRGLVPANQLRLSCLSLFWHFLDVIWIGVFTFVYLLGVLR